MDNFKNLSIKIKNYKCFGEELQGFDSIMPINLIIGKNNTGKSALLDCINFLCRNKQEDKSFLESPNKSLPNYEPEIQLGANLDKDELISYFGENEIRVNERLVTFYDYLINKSLISKFYYASINNSIVKEYFVEYCMFDGEIDKIYGLKDALKNKFRDVVRNNRESIYPIFKKYFFRLLSDRDIILEANEFDIKISSNGQGCTNAFRRFRIGNDLKTELITENILSDLNLIYEPDIEFEDITVLENKDHIWEIYLSDKNKKEIPISKSGSGLKTVLLVLCYVHLIPYLQKKSLSDFIFAFEELENNLHPSLQRKLFSYLKDIAVSKKVIIFITTHSNIAIDFFSKDDNAQIVHVKHNGKFSQVKKVISYHDQKHILDDLEVKASDLLQSNCIVWVEGPSDRIYFNRWIELYTNNALIEGYHYQCLFYGGKLMAGMSADNPELQDKLVNILSINNNAIMIIDSDKTSNKEEINDTKLRIQTELEKNNGLIWITEGKEIENYLPKEALCALYGLELESLKQIDKYEIFENYLNRRINKDEGKRFVRSKVSFASKIQVHFKLEDIKKILDLDVQMSKVIEKIKIWNGIDK